MILFKYRQDNPNAEKIITEGKVWLSRPAQLNDPLECGIAPVAASLRSSFRSQSRKTAIDSLVVSVSNCARRLDAYHGLSAKDAKRWLFQFKRLTLQKQQFAAVVAFYKDRRISPPPDPDAFFDEVECQLKNVGILSLSETAENQPMWAHYADNHAGLAFGFEKTEASMLGNGDHTFPVTYTDAKPVMTTVFPSQWSFSFTQDARITASQRLAFTDPFFRAAISTKTTEWAYEREWRYVEESHGLYPWPGNLREIIFGMKMPPIRRSYYRHLVSQHVRSPVKLFEIRPSSDNAKLQKVPLS
jgi:hypothetical protein